MNIKEVNENRTDFCWHTNYLANPEKYFKIDNFAKMQVSHFKGSNMHYAFLANDGYENDYIALGKRGDKCFVRMYLKTKEVVEMGYKPWFINLWFFNELISRYDKYVLENCFDLRNWKVKDIIRLQFYYDYGQNEQYKQMCYAAMESYFRKGSCNWDYVGKLADKLTPKITTIMNVEFLRLVDRNTALKKCKCTDTPFWQSIKRTKMIDVRKKNKNISPLLREYSREHNIEVVKNSFINKAITLGIYTHGIDYKEDIQTTIADNLCLLNDNDVKRAERYRSKVSTRLNKKDWEGDFNAAYK